MNRRIEYYVLTPVFKPSDGGFSIVNASVGVCGLCGAIATGMGGSPNDICLKCAEVVISGRAKGAIIWSDATSEHKV